MTTEIIKTQKQFRALENEWNALLEQSSADSVYLTWEWLYTWWEVFQQGRELCLITVRDNGRLIGIAPLLVRAVRYARIIPLRRLEFLGTGEAGGDEVCSNYMDFIIAKDKADTVLPVILQALTDGSVSWDDLLLKSVPEQSSSLAAMKNHLKGKNVIALTENTAPCLYIHFTGTFEDYLNTLSQNVRRNIRRYRKLLTERGEVSYSLHDSADAARFLDDFIAIHRQRWSNKETVDAFSSALFTDFHRRVIPLMAPKGWIKIAFLRHNQQIIAASYHYVYKGRLYAYQVGCNDQYDRQVGTGMTEYSYSIEAAVNSGCREYDFYRSNLQGYKGRLAKNQRLVVDAHFARPTLPGRALQLVAWLKSLRKKEAPPAPQTTEAEE